MEKLGADHPLHKLKKKHKWAQEAVDRMEAKGTKGSLTKIAKEHGESPMEFAREHVGDKKHPSWSKKSNFAVNVNK